MFQPARFSVCVAMCVPRLSPMAPALNHSSQPPEFLLNSCPGEPSFMKILAAAGKVELPTK